MTEDERYRRYLAGDREAGDELMHQCKDELIRYLNAFLHNREDAEDLMLECFTVILVDCPKIRDGNFRPYLFRMARYKAMRQKKAWLRQETFELDESLPGGEGIPEEAVWKNERSLILQRCLNRIAPQYREAIWLVYVLGMSYAQAAEVMHGTEKRVEDCLRNGKKQLRQELEKEGITHEDI